MDNNGKQTVNPVFWRRLGAFIIDILLLGIFGFGLGVFFSEQFIQLGPWGRVVGFSIAALYFTLLNSHIGKGQTIGKRLLKIRIMKQDGSLLNPLQSFFRYLTIAIPFFLGGALLPDEIFFSIIGAISVSILIYGLGLSIVYLFIFNRRTRQSLHDLLLGTYVVRVAAQPPIRHENIWPVHYGVCVMLVIVALIVPFVLRGYVFSSPFFVELNKARNEIKEISKSRYVSIRYGRRIIRWRIMGSNTTTYIVANVWLRSRQVDTSELSVKVVNALLKHHADAAKRDIISASFSYGYDIGIARFRRTFKISFPPDRWRQIIKRQLDNSKNRI